MYWLSVFLPCLPPPPFLIPSLWPSCAKPSLWTESPPTNSLAFPPPPSRLVSFSFLCNFFSRCNACVRVGVYICMCVCLCACVCVVSLSRCFVVRISLSLCLTVVVSLFEYLHVILVLREASFAVDELNVPFFFVCCRVLLLLLVASVLLSCVSVCATSLFSPTSGGRGKNRCRGDRHLHIFACMRKQTRQKRAQLHALVCPEAISCRPKPKVGSHFFF